VLIKVLGAGFSTAPPPALFRPGASDAVYGLVDEIIEADKVDTVMLIPGGLGETTKSREPAAAMAAQINAAHGKAGGGPVFLGANCLGVVSHLGSYDSWFIPLERLPKPKKKPERNSVMLSQSGAFMITRLSHNPWLDPRYVLAMGNQTDLTHGDLLLEHIEPGKDSVGTRVELDHTGATLLGMWVEITVTLASVNGNAVSFDFTVRDAVEEVARGKHNRFIVGIEKTAQRLKAKLAKAGG